MSLLGEKAQRNVQKIADGGHPGRDVIVEKMKEKYLMVPNAVIEKVISECNVCLQGKRLPKVAVGKPIMAKGV